MKEISALVVMKRGRYKGQKYTEVPMPYRQWLDGRTATPAQVIEGDIAMDDRRLSTLANWELEALLENEDLTLWEHEMIKDYLAIPHR